MSSKEVKEEKSEQEILQEKIQAMKQLIESTKGKRKSVSSVIARTKRQRKNQYCLFYNLKGECGKGSNCAFIHDSRKLSICRAFLKDKCEKADECLLSHQLSTDKMPDCVHFQTDTCLRENCPYRHVKVAQDSIVCKYFSKGYCPEGQKCSYRHEFPKKTKSNSAPPSSSSSSAILPPSTSKEEEEDIPKPRFYHKIDSFDH